jgi:DNA-binding MarR family transcriptional regulator
MKKSRPEQEAFVAILRAAERLSQDAAALLKPHGITPVQYNVLRILRGARPEGLNCGQIAERMISREPDMTRLLDRMAGRGWLERERQEADRRVVLVLITQEGLDLLARLDEPVYELHKRQFARLPHGMLSQLMTYLVLVGIPEKERA